MLELDRVITRGQLDKFVFTQVLIGADQDRILRWFLQAAVLLSFVIGPLLLLGAFGLRFRPYRSHPVTDVQLGRVLLDRKRP